MGGCFGLFDAPIFKSGTVCWGEGVLLMLFSAKNSSAYSTEFIYMCILHVWNQTKCNTAHLRALGCPRDDQWIRPLCKRCSHGALETAARTCIKYSSKSIASLGKFGFLMKAATERRPRVAVSEGSPYGNTSRDGVNASFWGSHLLCRLPLPHHLWKDRKRLE